MLSILDQPDAGPVISWLRDLIAGKFTHLILLTGEGLRRLLGFATREGLRHEMIAALGRINIITRGPKPVRALKEIGLGPTSVAAAPTTDGVIQTLKQQQLSGVSVGVQLYSESNPPLIDYLASAGARAYPVSPYIYAPAADADRVADLIAQLADGKLDAIVFTSSPQIDRLFEVAAERKLDDQLRRGLERVKVAVVGPIVKDNLLAKQIRVDIMPEQGFVMKNLVQHIKRVF
jgi:uroporphyrinogen-III synthase